MKNFSLIISDTAAKDLSKIISYFKKNQYNTLLT